MNFLAIIRKCIYGSENAPTPRQALSEQNYLSAKAGFVASADEKPVPLFQDITRPEAHDEALRPIAIFRNRPASALPIGDEND